MSKPDLQAIALRHRLGEEGCSEECDVRVLLAFIEQLRAHGNALFAALKAQGVKIDPRWLEVGVGDVRELRSD